MNKKPSDLLREAAAMFDERDALYGSNYKRFPVVLLSMFPGQTIPEIKTVEDAQRLQLMIQATNKIVRYAENFHRGGHKDSARDLCVYAAMLEEATAKDAP